MGYGDSVLVGISFAAGWTPCIGPILASVLVMSASNLPPSVNQATRPQIGFTAPDFTLKDLNRNTVNTEYQRAFLSTRTE